MYTITGSITVVCDTPEEFTTALTKIQAAPPAEFLNVASDETNKTITFNTYLQQDSC